jgi:hypothetical protein
MLFDVIFGFQMGEPGPGAGDRSSPDMRPVCARQSPSGTAMVSKRFGPIGEGDAGFIDLDSWGM